MTVQKLVIEGWLPEQIANGSHGSHWAKQKKLKAAQEKVLSHAFAARWMPLTTRAKLDIVLVFPTQRRRDIDNLYSRCKGLVDGTKRYIVDDDTEHLDLHVSARYEKGRSAVEMTLEAA